MHRRHYLQVATAAGLAALGVDATAEDDQGVPLGEAVAEFNRRAQADAVGRTQPPLTEEEVVAAIRGWIRKRVEAPDDVFALYQQIAASRRLPEGARLDFTTRWTGYRGFDFDVWWVDLEVRTGASSGYNYRLRDQKLGSRPSPPPAKRDPSARFPLLR